MSFGLNSLLKKFYQKDYFIEPNYCCCSNCSFTINNFGSFFDSIWIKANKGMTKSLVSEVKTLFETYRSGDSKM